MNKAFIAICFWQSLPDLPPPGGVLRVSSDGDDRMGAKIKTQKNPLRASNKTQKIPGQKLTPKKSHVKFPNLKNF